MLKHCKKSEITFFGEYHNNAISHWLQFELTEDLSKFFNNQLVLGFEMFEVDQQDLFDHWQSGTLTQSQLEDSLRLWKNYKTDYKPLVVFGKENGIKIVASNVPRRLASVAFKNGREGLLNVMETDKHYMVSHDFIVDTTLSQYNVMLKMVGDDHGKAFNFVLAQAIKDATMAKSIHGNLLNNFHFIHFNGSFHTDFDQGIIYYLKLYRPKLIYTTISTVEQADVNKLENEHKGKANFIICVNQKVTKTH